MRHVPELLPYARRMGPPRPKHPHRIRAASIQQERRVSKTSAKTKADVLSGASAAQSVLNLQQEVSVARVDVDTQTDTHGGTTVHVSVLL